MAQISNESLHEGTDLKRIVLLFIRKVWIIVAITVLGIIIGAVCYKIYAGILDGEPTYQVSTDYKLTFNFDEFPNGMDFYNAYTWGQFIKDDKPVAYAMDAVSGFSRQDIYDSISSEMVSDYRILTIKVTGKDSEKVEKISDAYEIAMPMFADDIPEILTIEVWTTGETEVVNLHTRTASAAFLGGLIALLSSLFGFALYYVMDNRIYTETDFNRDFADVVFLGYDSERYKADLEANTKVAIGDKKIIVCENVSASIDEIKKNDGCVISIPWGKVSSQALRYDLELLKKQGCNVAGVQMTNCNERFLKAYYGR